MTELQTLISCSALQELLGDEELVILDGSWFLPNANRDGHAEYNKQHIPGARFFDIDKHSDQNTDLPHMVPTATEFAKAAESLGISNHSRVVIYDAQGLFSAARVWWLFRLFGHNQVAVLDGGLPAWIASGYAVTDEVAAEHHGSYQAKLQAEYVVNLKAMQKKVGDRSATILDARPFGRFTGESAEPRPELESGHMPGATSLPASALLEAGKLKSVSELQSIFAAIPVDQHTPVITTCGSGVTAAIITLAMTHCGLGMHQLYDGSWTEWASIEENPIEKG